jgi:hypothetical protein
MTTSRRRASRPAPTRDVLVKVDAGLKRRWEQNLEALREAQAAGAGAFDALWETAAAIVAHEPPLYVVGGFANAAEFFREVLHEDARNARRLIRVARFATPAEEQRYGTTVLDAALAYLEAMTGGVLDGALPVAFDRLKIPVVRNGRAVRLGLAEVSVREVVAATRALRRGRSRPARGSAARAALASALGTTRALAGVQVSEARGMASFQRVPLAALDAFARALLRAKVPPPPTAGKARRSRQR